jgi:hypothetical protein
MTEKVELGSPEWLEIAREFLTARAAQLGEQLDGVNFAICEVLTDPPAHLANGAPNQVAWQFRFDGPRVDVRFGDATDVDFRQVADYQTILPFARIVYSDNPEELAASRERRKGKEAPALPAVLAPTLLDMHDHLARRTA